MAGGGFSFDLIGVCVDCGAEVDPDAALARPDRRLVGESDGDADGCTVFELAVPGSCTACGGGRVRIRLDL